MVKTALLATISSLGIGFTALGGLYISCYESVWDKVSDDAVPDKDTFRSEDSLSSIWAKLASKLPELEKIHDENLKRIKNSSDSKNKNLRDWCFEKYRLTYKDLFQKSNNSLLEDTRTACIRKIGDHIDTSIKLSIENSESNKQDYLSKVEKLKNNKEEVLQDTELLKIQKNKDESWKELRNWCRKIYEKGYQGEETNRWKLTKLYCTR